MLLGSIVILLSKGAKPRSKSRSTRPSIFSSARDWQVRADLDGKVSFLQHVVLTNLRPDIVLWAYSVKEVILGGLTVPWEDNIDYAFKRKLARYSELDSRVLRQRIGLLLSIEVGCRGFVARSTTEVVP